MLRVEIKPELLSWACERGGFELEELAHRLPKLPEWITGKVKPTLKQVERFARAVHVPIGYLFLSDPPVERLPIPDFRTVGNEYIDHLSPDLLDTIYLCQQRQEWYHDYAQTMGEPECPIVASAKLGDDVESTATQIRNTIGFDLDARRKMKTWEEALRQFIQQVDEVGVLVMVNGVVGNNNHRRLDPDEFRGFALSDRLAPLIFINGADTKSAQMFTLSHELAHICVGSTGLFDVELFRSPTDRVELWCNRVAAEVLVPLNIIRAEYQKGGDLSAEVGRLSRRFKVSTLVILRRLYDAGFLKREKMWAFYKKELSRLQAIPKGSGGDFYLTQAARVSKRFARALIGSTLEGMTLHRDALNLLGFSKLSTFQDLGNKLGIG